MTFTQLYIQENLAISSPWCSYWDLPDLHLNRFPYWSRRRLFHGQDPREALLSDPPGSHVHCSIDAVCWPILRSRESSLAHWGGETRRSQVGTYSTSWRCI